MQTTRHVSIHITGKVQGVFYRRDACRQGLALGLAGFVRNEPDGSVYAEAEGTEKAVGAFINWCRRGPPNARVEDVQVEELEPRDQADGPGFHVMY